MVDQKTTQKPRQVLRVPGISPEQKAALIAKSKDLYGTANYSALIRQILADYLNSTTKNMTTATALIMSEEQHRIEFKLPASVITELEKRAENRFSTRNNFIKTLIYSELGHDQLHGDEVEVLRKSNYELSKIGTNINQIARAFNVLIQMKGGDKMPEIGKKIASLRKEISSHTSKVLKVLEAKTKLQDVKKNPIRRKK